MQAPVSLSDAFGLVPGDCVAIVGGGGKTTIMYRLAAEAATAGRSVIVGGTTRFTPPQRGTMPPVALVDIDADPIPPVRAALQHSRAVTCSAGHGDKGRWLPISCEQAAAITAARIADLMVLEADGSRNRPLKAPGEAEPSIPDTATVVLAVVGLDALGQPLDDRWVHRSQVAAELAGVPHGLPITVEVIARLLLSNEGGQKRVPAGARWVPVLNKAEPERSQAGRDLARLLIRGGAATVVLATAAGSNPVVQVSTSSQFKV